MVRPHEQRNSHPEDDDQGVQAQSMEAVRQAAVEAALQAMEDVYNPRLVALKWALEGLRLFMDENQEKSHQQRANHKEGIQGVNHDEQPRDYHHEEV